ncbi:dipeptide/oligopeptide/nickel ABC transporter permease/ATP-binding protein [Kribbella monticola]|uniref:dipeptide/oligopeptide/nickel ABC transporter permease/ATP-binding protein n=1 Tax=Kribbella monticola TaxID=2185285 RepID=UPI000DD35C59|nr:dipeptide/oligopeptide/nickel ABC transporter permease/ATP-binding protein [Kribbella monticola]
MKRTARWIAVLRTPVGAGAGVLLLAVLLLALVAPLLWSHQATAIDTEHLLEGTSAKHWLGTDNLGRDIFYRVLVASRTSILLALIATSIAVVCGLALGCAPTVLGRRGGRLATAVVNIAVAFPGLLLALFFAVVFGVGAKGAVLAIGLAGAPSFARLTQTLVAGIEKRDFVAAARIAGVGRFRMLSRHILPNIAEPLVVNATIGAGGTLLAFAGLSFLGLGVQPPAYDWGRLMGESLNSIYVHPAAALAPGVAVVIAGLAFNLFGEAVAKGFGVPVLKGSRLPQGETAPAAEVDEDAVLVVKDLHVSFPGPVTPVRGISFTIGRSEIVGVVGESGSGKSLTALAVAQLIESPGQVRAAELSFLGAPLLGRAAVRSTAAARRRLLGTSFAMVFQDPMTSLNPTMRVGAQLAEGAREHQGMSRRQAMNRAVDRLRAVRIPLPERRAHQYPHEFSGGMRQRAMIGMGLMGTPALIVADEPTTALDVTVQRQVLELLEQIRTENEVAVLLISHDITVVGQVCDRVLVMYAGRIVEDLPASELYTGARHPYTRALSAAVPDLDTPLDEPLAVISGRPVDPAHYPSGCAFAARCEFATDRCRTEDPALVSHGPAHQVACWNPQGSAAWQARYPGTESIRTGQR